MLNTTKAAGAFLSIVGYTKVIINLSVFEVKADGSRFRLIELAPGVTLEEIAKKTETACEVAP